MGPLWDQLLLHFGVIFNMCRDVFSCVLYRKLSLFCACGVRLRMFFVRSQLQDMSCFIWFLCDFVLFDVVACEVRICISIVFYVPKCDFSLIFVVRFRACEKTRWSAETN